MKKKYFNLIVFFIITAAIFVFYNGFQKNYYFSDDFQWVSHAVLVDDSPAELFLVRGRDFNPLLTLLFWMVIKVGGLSPLLFRLLCFFCFTGALFMLYYLLSKYFRVNTTVALCAVLLCGFNVYISEVVLYLSTFVYALTLLLFFSALKFYLDGKKVLYILFMLLAFQVKETIILTAIPLFLYEKKRNYRLLIVLSSFSIFLTRFLFQLGSTGSYTHFAGTENLFYKLYFLILHPMNISPYAMGSAVGIGLIVITAVVFAYFLKADRRALFFGSFFAVYIVFFSFLPKLSSKYYFYPSFAFWGCAALLGNYFYKRSKHTKYVLFGLLILSLLFNYPAVKEEIADYKILGEFSKNFIELQERIIKSEITIDKEPLELRIHKVNFTPLRSLYSKILERGNMLKLLPFRKYSIGGLITPTNLIPIIYYPEKIVRWQPVKVTPLYFVGRCIPSAGD
ncbi:MAG: hypothetical protein KAW12_30340 [Candidatus Aminicenantes bacterium]|nr:hypothetical protein [Candidatus Aminicenantes bacterium]